MPIFVKKPTSTKVYELVPEGQHQAVLTVQDLGVKQTAFGPKEKVLMRWTIAQRDKDGYRISAAEFFNKVFGPKAKLTEFCIDVIGKDPSNDPTFDLESMNGINKLIIVKHSKGEDGRVFANVKARLDVPAGAPLLPATDGQAPNQTGKINQTAAKPGANTNTNPSAITAANPITDQDVAFA